MDAKPIIFEYSDLKAYLRQIVKSERRGFQVKLARKMCLSASHINRLIYDDVKLTVDQAGELCQLLQLTPLQSEYFLLLRMLSNATKEDTKNIILKLLSDIRKRATDDPNVENGNL